ncbi:MAG: tetratricopeptide repeat protein [Defluviicoccus sp.]|nr:tetratricopeptide repeat protein [Defluviicoccus sp.]MDE0275138.1 tetratricopeptide repeat protein [Defluviicoccus sp.]
MTTRTDCRGLEITAASDGAVAGFDRTVGAYLGLRIDTGDHLKATLEADPSFVMANVLRGYFMLLFASRKLLGRALSSLEAAREGGCNRREELHIDALAAWGSGDQKRALDIWDSILTDWPRDVLALKLSEYWNFYLGDCCGMREIQARVAPHWDESVPDYGKVLGMSAFALEECGAYDEAERRGRRAVEIDGADIWATHAVAHVMEMTGRQRDGIAWIDGKAADFGGCNAFANHLWWHRALFHFELGRFDAVLDLYDREVLPRDAFEYLDICNAVSILWRLEEEGVDVGDRWERVADAAAERADDLQLVFTDVHYAMAFAAAGRKDALDALIAGAEAFAQAAEGTQAEIMAEYGLALSRAAAASGSEDWETAVDLLYPRRRGITAIGGSHAQRDLFRRALIHAAENAGRDRLASSLLAERCADRATSPIALRRYARVLSALGETDAAAAAAARAATLVQ